MHRDRFKLVVTTHLILLKEDQILLSLRKNTGYGDGLYSVISGTLNGRESVMEATLREATEEAGIKILQEDLKFACSMHCFSEDQVEFVEFFFIAEKWRGEVENMEPRLCEELRFFPKTQMPEKMIPYVARGIECSFNKIYYEEFGWKRVTVESLCFPTH